MGPSHQAAARCTKEEIALAARTGGESRDGLALLETRSASHRRGWAFPLLFIAVIAAGALLRLHFLRQSIRYDEAAVFLHFNSKSLADILTDYQPSNHLLHTLLVRLSTGFFDCGPAFLRLPALAAGILLIPASGWAAWRWIRRRWAVVAVMLGVAGHPILVEYSCNARGYSLFALFVVLSSTALREALRRQRAIFSRPPSVLRPASPVQRSQRADRRMGKPLGGASVWWAAWSLAVAAGFWTMPVMLVPWVAQMTAFCAALLFPAVGKPRCGNSRISQIYRSRALIASGLPWGFLGPALGSVAYLPALWKMGVAGAWSAMQVSTVRVYRSYIDDHGGTATLVWSGLTEHLPAWWIILVLGGALGLILSRRTWSPREGATALIIVLPLAQAWISSALFQWPLLAPQWIFVPPLTFIAGAWGWERCRAALGGRLERRMMGRASQHAFIPPGAGRLIGRFAWRHAARTGPCALMIAGAVWAGATAARQPCLAQWPYEMVDAEQVIELCARVGAGRWSLRSRYSPSLHYYLKIREAAPPTDAEDEACERVFVFVEKGEDPERRWHEGMPGFESFNPLHSIARLQRGELFAAERRTPSQWSGVDAP